MPDDNVQTEIEHLRSLEQLTACMSRIEGYIAEFQLKFWQLDEERRRLIRMWEEKNNFK
jgi:predicted DNA-binding protein with PD1-like motif